MPEPFDMDRRGLLQRALILVGATVAAGCRPTATTAKSGPFFDPPTFTLVSAIADTIVPATDTPGAIVAGVPKLLDALLRDWASPERQEEITKALAAIDKLGVDAGARGFAALTPEKRKEVLVPHDLASLKQVPRKTPKGAMEMMQGPAYADPGYGKLRELIVILYYYSETALTTELPYEHVPGEWKPSIPVTPETRNPGGLGLF